MELNSDKVRKTWREWDKLTLGGYRILDPDGFREAPEDKLYTRREFVEIRNQSTICPAEFAWQWGLE